jgi:hypothetical protein
MADGWRIRHLDETRPSSVPGRHLYSMGPSLPRANRRVRRTRTPLRGTFGLVQPPRSSDFDTAVRDPALRSCGPRRRYVSPDLAVSLRNGLAGDPGFAGDGGEADCRGVVGDPAKCCDSPARRVWVARLWAGRDQLLGVVRSHRPPVEIARCMVFLDAVIIRSRSVRV